MVRLPNGSMVRVERLPTSSKQQQKTPSTTDAQSSGNF